MSQHINLLPRQRATRADPIGLRNVLVVSAIALALVAAVGAWLTPRTAHLESEVARQRTALEQLQQAAGRAQRPVDTALAESLAEARRRARVLESAARYLQTARGEEVVRFSDYFAAFARRTLPGVWLTAFTAHASAGRIALTARATDSDLVSAYLRQLNREPLFRERSFTSLTVNEGELALPGPAKVEPNPEGQRTARIVEFSLLSSTAPAASGASRGSGS